MFERNLAPVSPIENLPCHSPPPARRDLGSASAGAITRLVELK